MEKGPPDVSWVRAAPGVGWAAAAPFPAEARPWVGTEVTRRKRFRKRWGRGQGAALEAPPPLKVALGGAKRQQPRLPGAGVRVRVRSGTRRRHAGAARDVSSAGERGVRRAVQPLPGT